MRYTGYANVRDTGYANVPPAPEDATPVLHTDHLTSEAAQYRHIRTHSDTPSQGKTRIRARERKAEKRKHNK